MGVLRKVFFSLAACGMGLAVLGCSQKEPPKPERAELPRNDELTHAFRDIMQARGLYDSSPRLLGISLFCEKAPGPIKVKVGLDVTGNEMKAPYTSTSPCTETGLLVAADLETRSGLTARDSGYYVRSKQPYDKTLVVSEWQKALDATLGTFAHNELASNAITLAYREALSDLHVELVNFTCDAASKKIVYRAHYQGDWRTGSTTLTCPDPADKSEVLARLATQRNGPANPNAPAYQVSTVKALDSMTVTKMVGDFLDSGRRRNSF